MTFEEEPKGTWCNTCKKWKKHHEDYKQKVKDAINMDWYHKIGKPKIWQESNDGVVELVKEGILKELGLDK